MKNLLCIFIVAIGLPMLAISEQPQHPLLLCTPDQFPELRARASKEPWKGMKARALEIADGDIPEFKRPRELQKYTGAVGLAYIVDPERQDEHAQRVKKLILENLSQIEFDPEKSWAGVVEPMGAAFTCILALDIVYNSLSQAEIEACEALIEQQLAKIPRKGPWRAGRLGTHGTWDIYKGIRTEPDDLYFRKVTMQMTDDGVSTVSPSYAFARLGAWDDRPQKSAYADVLEFTGIDRRYYNEPLLVAFYRFLFSAAVTPAKQNHLFGDVAPNWGTPTSALLWRVGRFDEVAAGYAAWFLDGIEPPGHLLPYILMNEPLPAPVTPESHLFYEGAAVFREPADDPMSLGAMLYAITENAEWHTHEEVNHLSLAAYGERILVNGGWLGEITRPPERNNTISINGERHASRMGAGLAEGLIGDGFDYACGDSGEALGENHFYRNLMLVHGRDGAPGYFVIFDEVDADPEDLIQLHLQPASEHPAEEIVSGVHYRSTLDHHTQTKGLSMDVLYVTPADKVQQDLIASGELKRDSRAGKHFRLSAEFTADAKGKRNLLTVILPRLFGKPMLETFQRSEGGRAVELSFPNGVTDTLIIGTPGKDVRFNGFTFRGSFLYARKKGEELYATFVKNGTRLIHRKKILLDIEQPTTQFSRIGTPVVSANQP